ncbi:MAG: nucleotidyltransferase domain-containing protein [Elusimicrobiota bacterium]
MRGRPNYLKRPLDSILSAPSNIAVLRVLKDTKQGMSGRAVAREAGFQHGAIRAAIAKLEVLGLIDRQGSGKTQLIRLNFEHHLVRDVLLPMFAAEKRTMGELRALLRKEFKDEAVVATLFGSAARGEEEPGSDIDILLVVKNGGKAKLLAKAEALGSKLAQRYGLRLSPLIRTAHELKSRPRRADPLINNILAEGIDLLDTSLEDFLA